MILSFDKFERYELPQVTLCNPNSRATEVNGKITITDTVGVLSNPKGMNLKLNFNAPHELSFDYYRHKSSDPIKQSFYDKIYEAIQTDRYIYLTDIGYFVISSVTDSDEDNIDKKSISLKSCEENEFATAEGLGLKEGTYQLHTEDNKGLLDLFLPKTAGWTIGFIDPALLVKYDSETDEEKAVERYVEKTEVDNGYNFLYTTIQDMFECIVEPDIVRRTVSVYSREYYAEHHLTDIHIAKYNLLKHKTVEENDEDKYTALNVQGKDENLEIRTVNPTGKNVIYNFESRYAWMSPALRDAVIRWQEKCESVEDEYLTLQQGYYDDMQNIIFPLEQDIKVLELQLKQQQQTRDLIVIGEQDKAIDIVESLPQTGKSDVLYFVPTTVNNYEEYVWENNSWKYIDLIQVDDISDTTQQRALDLVNAAINNTNVALSGKQSTFDTEKNNVETNYSQPISDINKECALETTSIFTTELRNELMTHIKPTDYVDEYMLVTESMTYPEKFEKAKELMDRAQSQLIKISSGQKTYSIDTRSFLFNKQFKHFSEQLCAGAIIYVETKSDTMEQLHLTGIDINFDEKSTNFTLGNKYDRSDLKALYDEALGQNSKSFSELKYIASIIEDQQKQLDYQRNWVGDLRTLTLENVLTSEDQAIEINNRGLIGRKRQLNEDGSWKTDENDNPLFDPEQVKLINNTLVFTDNNWQNATTAVGKIAVGYNPDGSVKYAYGINGQVLIGELILGNNLVLTGTGAGITITDNHQKNVFYADDDGNLNITGKITALEGGSIGGWQITKNALLKEVTFDAHKYQIFMQAPENPSKNDTAFAVHNITTGEKPFSVTYGGHAEMTGKITANEGDFAGWNIKKTYIYGQENNGEVKGTYTVLKSSGDVAFAAGVPSNWDVDTGDTATTGAKLQIFHSGTLRAGGDGGSDNEDYALVVSGGTTYFYKEAIAEGKFTANSGIDTTTIQPTSRMYFYDNKTRDDSKHYLSLYSETYDDNDADSKAMLIEEKITKTDGTSDWVTRFHLTYGGKLTANGGISTNALNADAVTASGLMTANGQFRYNKQIFTLDKDAYVDSRAYLSMPSPYGQTINDTYLAGYAINIQSQGDNETSKTTKLGIRWNGGIDCRGVVNFYNTVNFKSTVNISNLKADNLIFTAATMENFSVSNILTAYGITITNNIQPGRDGYISLGSSSNRFSSVYAVTGTIQTSDRNMKENIAGLTDIHKQLFMKLIPVSFTFVDGASGRTHIGFISQDVENAMAELGMTSLDFAGLCKDVKMKTETDKEGKEVEVPDLDENGNEQYLYALRYDEFIALTAYVLQDTVGRLDAIEERLAKLETF